MFLLCIGNISYWKKVTHSESYDLLTHHTFQKQSELSQYEVATSNGRLKLSVPTIKKTRKGAYCNVEIDYSSPWVEEHRRTIENAYHKSPFYLYYGYKINAVFDAKPKYLLELNRELFYEIKKCLRLQPNAHINTTTAVYFAPTAKQAHSVYPQVFDTKNLFEENLSILDLLFNLGPETVDYLQILDV